MPPAFRFSQFDVTWPLGPPDGRYLVRGAPTGAGAEALPGAATHVIVLATLEAPELPSRLRARLRRGAPDGDSVTWLTRATVIDVAGPLEEAQAAAWLREADESALADGLAVLNRALYAYRLAAADPLLSPLERRQALRARLGYGAGEQVAEGEHSEVRELALAPTERSRRRMLAPDARVAALLTGREQPLVCEELALRARADLSARQPRHAALQLLIALDTAIAELAGDPALAERVAELRGHREPVAAAAQTALSAELGADGLSAVFGALERVEAALRARAAARR